MNNYKDTLLMPKTDFPMKGNLPIKEIKIQDFWEKNNVYGKALEKKTSKTFNLHDGPPFANGDVHVGHALNKILKDFINRNKSLLGYKVRFVAGWDTHGLPIEQEVIKKNGRKILNDIENFRKICEKFALTQVNKQLKDFKRLGIFTDWNEKYLTLLPEYEAKQLEVFSIMVEKGLVNKGVKIVPYSPTSETALAEAEIEYKDIRSTSIYVKFTLQKSTILSRYNNPIHIIIWTSTPWTLLANVAVSVGDKFDYLLVEYKEEAYIVADQLFPKLKTLFSWENVTILKKIKGKTLEKLIAINPIIDRESIVIMGEHVTLDMGTGAVHTAPAYGEDDFNVCERNKLPLISITDKKGMITYEDKRFNNMFYSDSIDLIIEQLKENNKLVHVEEITHSYPHDWRTKKPIIYWATEQWFINVEKIKDKILTVIQKEIDFILPWSKVRLKNLIENRKQWCISRQRKWGVPIPIFYSEDKKPILDAKLVLHIAELFRKHGSNIWYTWEVKDLLPENYKHINSPNNIFYKEQDIMDVWIDSGTSYSYVSSKYDIQLPFDLYLEGSDQYRGWFNSSLTTCIIANGIAPYKQLLSAGFVVDKDGRKMSKSIGNVISPQNIIKQYGADILRLWVCSSDFSTDIKISQEIIKNISERYRKIRNTFRFILGNISDFKENYVEYDDLESIDKYTLQLLKNYKESVDSFYSNYDFSSIFKTTMVFVNNTLSSFYLDYIKDILYCDKENSLRRRQVQTVIDCIFKYLVVTLAPIIPHTCEEVWHSYLKAKNLPLESVFLSDIELKIINNETFLTNKWGRIMVIRKQVLKVLEEKRNCGEIGKALDAEIILYLNDSYKRSLSDFTQQELNRLFIVSKVTIQDNHDNISYTDIGRIIVNKYDGKMCQRCWNRFENEDLEKEDLCHRCYKVIN